MADAESLAKSPQKGDRIGIETLQRDGALVACDKPGDTARLAEIAERIRRHL